MNNLKILVLRPHDPSSPGAWQRRPGAGVRGPLGERAGARAGRGGWGAELPVPSWAVGADEVMESGEMSHGARPPRVGGV